MPKPKESQEEQILCYEGLCNRVAVYDAALWGGLSTEAKVRIMGKRLVLIACPLPLWTALAYVFEQFGKLRAKAQKGPITSDDVLQHYDRAQEYMAARGCAVVLQGETEEPGT